MEDCDSFGVSSSLTRTNKNSPVVELEYTLVLETNFCRFESGQEYKTVL